MSGEHEHARDLSHPVCDECAYWQRPDRQRGDDPGVGTCRRRAPVVVAMNSLAQPANPFPIVRDVDWCGEHVPAGVPGTPWADPG